MAQRLKTDWILFSTVVLMVLFGALMIYSASSVVAEMRMGTSYYFALRQLIWIAIAIPLMMFMKRLNYRKLQTPAVAFTAMGLVMILLAVVYFADPKQHRWIRFGPSLAGCSLPSLPNRRWQAVSRLFHSVAFARHQQPLHAAAGLSRPRVRNHGGGCRGSWDRHRAGRDRRRSILRGRPSNRVTFVIAFVLGIVGCVAAIAAKPYRLVRV